MKKKNLENEDGIKGSLKIVIYNFLSIDFDNSDNAALVFFL